VLQEYLKRKERGDQLTLIDPAIIGKSFQDLFQNLLKDPDKLIQAQVEFWKNYLDLWQTASKRVLGHETQPVIQPLPGDKRFKDEQ
jgi:polyhydroxyalkanoate synthase